MELLHIYFPFIFSSPRHAICPSSPCLSFLAPPPSGPHSLPVRVLAAADIWSGCLVIDWQVMRRLKGRWRQEQVFSTVFLASAKLPCPSLLYRSTLLPLSLCLSHVLFLLLSFLLFSIPLYPHPNSLPERRGLCNPSHGDTVGHRLSLYGENASAVEINRETSSPMLAAANWASDRSVKLSWGEDVTDLGNSVLKRLVLAFNMTLPVQIPHL